MNLGNSETKVGLFTIIALFIVFSLFLWLSGVQLFQSGTNIEAIFDRIQGLRPGALVQLAGVDVGRVSRIYFDDRQVVVVMRIQRGVNIPRSSKVLIGSSGVIGDKFLEIIPGKPGEVTTNNKRLIGVNPVTMEQFYATAYEVLDSLRAVTYSLKSFITDPEVTNSLKNTFASIDGISGDLEKITGQLQNIDIVQLFNRINNIAMMGERLIQDNEPRLNDLVANINKVASQLAEITITANHFLKDTDDNGQTAANLKKAITNAEKLTADLEKFTAILANKQQNIEQLLQTAPETMLAIKAAADNINKAIDQLTTGDGALSQVNQTIAQTNQAVEKVNNYITAFEQISVKNSIGADYQKDRELMIRYKMNLHVDQRNSLLLVWNDIGQDNTATLQWAFNSPNFISRVGLYKNKFGLGLDVPLSSRFLFGLNVWDNNSPNMSLSSNWEITPNWALSLESESNLETENNNWNLGLWRNF